MNYKLSKKNKSGKWWTYGNIKKNQWGNLQASFTVQNIRELLELAESENSQWINLSMFEEDNKQRENNNTLKQNDFVDDSIPF